MATGEARNPEDERPDAPGVASARDPFAEANRVLAEARAIRGAAAEEPADLRPRHPLERAGQALEAAERARAVAVRPDPPEKRLARALREASLRRFKRQLEQEAE